jgi:hypothetical protein
VSILYEQFYRNNASMSNRHCCSKAVVDNKTSDVGLGHFTLRSIYLSGYYEFNLKNV